MNRMPIAMMLFLIVAHAVIMGQERFQLVSALRTGYGDAAGTSSYTAYHYDAEGNRVDQRVFDGVDSAAALMSSVRYSYDTQKRCTEDLLLGTSGDTLSMVRYAYGPDGLVSARTLNKDQSVRFSDSLLYTGGVLIEQRRYSASSQMTFYHRYGSTAGLLSSDSLYESNGGGGFAATQARILARNADSTVSSEAQWRVAGGQWYRISTTMMAYANKHLVSATAYEGDATTKRLIDSLACTVDSYGNRTLEAHFDNERQKTYAIAYTWRDTQPVGVASRAVDHGGGAHLAYNKGRLDFSVPVSGSLVLCGINGRRIWERRLVGEVTASLPTGLSAGNYVAMVRGTVNQSLSITIHN